MWLHRQGREGRQGQRREAHLLPRAHGRGRRLRLHVLCAARLVAIGLVLAGRGGARVRVVVVAAPAPALQLLAQLQGLQVRGQGPGGSRDAACVPVPTVAVPLGLRPSSCFHAPSHAFPAPSSPPQALPPPPTWLRMAASLLVNCTYSTTSARCTRNRPLASGARPGGAEASRGGRRRA
jgi:hypothetical protein